MLDSRDPEGLKMYASVIFTSSESVAQAFDSDELIVCLSVVGRTRGRKVVFATSPCQTPTKIRDTLQLVQN